MEQIWRDQKGTLLSRVVYKWGENGALLEEEWEEKEDDGNWTRGRCVYTYNKDGKQIDKAWFPK